MEHEITADYIIEQYEKIKAGSDKIIVRIEASKNTRTAMKYTFKSNIDIDEATFADTPVVDGQISDGYVKVIYGDESKEFILLFPVLAYMQNGLYWERDSNGILR